MKILGNIIWWIFGGLEAAFGYFTGSLALACTIIGIPFALQTFKIGLLCLWPFGSTVSETDCPTGCIRIPLNLIWLLCGGLWASLGQNSISRWPGFRSHHLARMWSWDYKVVRKRS